MKRQTGVFKIKDETGAMIGSGIAVLNLKPDDDLPVHVSMYVPYAGRPLPTLDELQRFDQIQVTLDELILTHAFAQVAAITHDGQRRYMLYAPDGPGFLAILKAVFTEPDLEFEWREDRNWTEYAELFGRKENILARIKGLLRRQNR